MSVRFSWWGRGLVPFVRLLSGCSSGGQTADDAGAFDAASAPDAAEDAQALDAADADDSEAAAPHASSLVHNALWTPVSGQDDPFGSLAGGCAPDSFGEESLGGELVFYVRTERCTPLTVTQRSRAAVQAGATLRVRAYHFPLTAPEGAVATLVLRLGEDEIFREEIPIPSDQQELTSTWSAPRSVPEGTPVWFHVENHGANEYALISVDVE